MRVMRNAYKMLVINLKVRCQLGDLGIDGRIILKQILHKYWNIDIGSHTVTLDTVLYIDGFSSKT
jgi:hypothetical protein